MVTISVQVMGGTRKLFLEVAEDITVAELRRVVARTSGTREAHRLKLIARGRALRDEDGAASLAEGAALLAVTAPLPPPQAAQAQADTSPAERDADAVRFELPADASPWARRAAAFCQERLHLPELLMVVLFSVQPWVWCAAAAWLAGAPIAHRLEVGPLYVLASAAALIFVNLGTRKPGEASAYSVFNDFRELPGQLNAAAMDDQLRRGQL